MASPHGWRGRRSRRPGDVPSGARCRRGPVRPARRRWPGWSPPTPCSPVIPSRARDDLDAPPADARAEAPSTALRGLAQPGDARVAEPRRAGPAASAVGMANDAIAAAPPAPFDKDAARRGRIETTSPAARIVLLRARVRGARTRSGRIAARHRGQARPRRRGSRWSTITPKALATADSRRSAQRKWPGLAPRPKLGGNASSRVSQGSPMNTSPTYFVPGHRARVVCV